MGSSLDSRARDLRVKRRSKVVDLVAEQLPGPGKEATLLGSAFLACFVAADARETVSARLVLEVLLELAEPLALWDS
jgi:hypothetical protein